MNTAANVSAELAGWLASGLLKSEVIVKLAEDCIGWPYVFGAVGELCTPDTRRKYYNNYKTRDPAEAEQIKKRCRVLSGASSCSGCTYYPGGATRCFDCRGFTRWVFGQVGIRINGAGCTSQWNDNSNWIQKGEIRDMPTDVVCCVFMRSTSDSRVMSHTGIHIGGGIIIHCSGTVKRGKTTDKGWTHYAIPKGVDGKVPTPEPGTDKPTLRRGSQGAYVTLAQTKLIQMGYDLTPYGADGKFGAKTEAAVKQFQRDQGLEADGIVGPKTWAALDDGKAETYTVTVQHISRSVAEEIIGKYGGTMTKEEGT